MAVKLRLARYGAKKAPFYKIIAIDSRSRRDGRFIEQLGYYNPGRDPVVLKIDLDRVDHWIKTGAKTTETVASLIKKARNA